MVAFNKAIEGELAEQAPPGVEVRTLHSFGLKTLTNAFGKVQLAHDKVPNLIRETLGPDLAADQRAALRKAVEIGKATLAVTVQDVRGIMQNFDINVPEEEEEDFAKAVLALLDACADQPQVVDYDDMIWLPVWLGIHPRPFDAIFIDETQDLNRCQVNLALSACSPSGRICAVGDDRQAIYSWRGADPQAVPRLIRRLKAKVLPLSVSYRCARSIVALAREIVPDYEAAPSAEEGSVAEATETILRREAAPGDFILSRTNAPLVKLCLSFLAEGRPATIAARDIGKGLGALVRRSRAETIHELRDWIDAWADREEARLLRRGQDASGPRDQAECIWRLADGARSIEAVLEKIEQLFSDQTEGAQIRLSTTHKAKGLERKRAWVLQSTYRRGQSVEEDNLWYVAITRAKSHLRLVQTAP